MRSGPASSARRVSGPGVPCPAGAVPTAGASPPWCRSCRPRRPRWALGPSRPPRIGGVGGVLGRGRESGRAGSRMTAVTSDRRRPRPCRRVRPDGSAEAAPRPTVREGRTPRPAAHRSCCRCRSRRPVCRASSSDVLPSAVMAAARRLVLAKVLRAPPSEAPRLVRRSPPHGPATRASSPEARSPGASRSGVAPTWAPPVGSRSAVSARGTPSRALVSRPRQAPRRAAVPMGSTDPARVLSEGDGVGGIGLPDLGSSAAPVVVTSLPARCLTSNIMAATRTRVRRANTKIRHVRVLCVDR